MVLSLKLVFLIIFLLWVHRQVRCSNSAYCSDKGVTVVITDQGSSANTDFILSQRAFGGMALNTNAAASLLALGVVDIEYRR